MTLDWTSEFPCAITVVDALGTIVEMNAKAADVFASDGGAGLVGTNVLECHPEPARTKLKQLLDERRANLYTIEKDGVKKMICQFPWFRDGKFSGLVELSIPLPAELPHFVRD